MKHPELAEMILDRSYHERRDDEEPFRLASGRTSRFYFECQRSTSYAPALPLIGRAFYELLDPTVACVGGLTRGADPIADAIAYYSAGRGRRIVHAFSVRKALKDHGTRSWIEGSAEPGDAIALVDDVVTSGSSVVQAAERCKLDGLRIVQVLVLVDREEGGLGNIREQIGPDVPVQAVFTFSELREYAREHPHHRLAPGIHRELAGSV